MSTHPRATSWQLHIDRVVVTGVTGRMPDSAELRALIEQHVVEAATAAALPAGRAVRASVQIDARSLSGGEAIARAVASGVSQAVASRVSQGAGSSVSPAASGGRSRA